ncbi:MAG: aminodeoxychorismate synthase component I [Sarcina sp.]
MDFKIKEFETNLEINQIYEIWKNEKDTILLDSSKEDSDYSRYSFIGINKFLKLNSKDGNTYIDNIKIEGNAFNILDKLLNEYKLDYKSELPFVGGAMGFISYDMSFSIEKIQSRQIDNTKIDDMYFVFFDNVIIFDLEKGTKYITSLGVNNKSEKTIANIKERIYNFEKSYVEKNIYSYNEDFSKFKSEFTKEEYIKTVDDVKKYIEEGHTYIMNLTNRFNCICEENSYDIYSKLRRINPAPFSAYLNIDGFEIISSSPERFLNIIDGKVETRPIKGTMPRGSNAEEDEKNKQVLISSEKDKSELLMVVDLERNDLSRVCRPFSVKVTELFKLEEYPTVFHLVSTIEGKLEESKTSVECLKACFPGGSITGTPKFRTIEIIDELERDNRGIYTGAIGYFDLRGNCDFNIVIRTILKKGNNAIFGVGGGITIESDPKSEYIETLDKAKALMRVL